LWGTAADTPRGLSHPLFLTLHGSSFLTPAFEKIAQRLHGGHFVVVALIKKVHPTKSNPASWCTLHLH